MTIQRMEHVGMVVKDSGDAGAFFNARASRAEQVSHAVRRRRPPARGGERGPEGIIVELAERIG